MNRSIILAFLLSILYTGCAQKTNTGIQELYKEFWTHVDENYIYFKQKGVNWDAQKVQWLTYLAEQDSQDDLFYAMEQSLLALKDGHNLLRAPSKRAKTYNFRTGYDVHFDLDVVKNNYLQDSVTIHDGINYSKINQLVYLHIKAMQYNNSLEQIIRSLDPQDTQGLIIDIRGNGGGNSNGVPHLLGLFVKEKTYLGAYLEKSGPGHNDVTEPLPVYANPRADLHLDYPVVVLTDRGSYSASTYFAAMFKGLPNVAIVGQQTGGGGGGNAGYELSNGWVVAVSVSDFIDKDGGSIEPGVVPDILVENSEDDLKQGRDQMLEKAIKVLLKE